MHPSSSSMSSTILFRGLKNHISDATKKQKKPGSHYHQIIILHEVISEILEISDFAAVILKNIQNE